MINEPRKDLFNVPTAGPADWEQQLEHGVLQPPGSFLADVMQQVRLEPAPNFQGSPHRAKRLQRWLRWLVLSGGALLGAAQLIGFMFGVWTAVAAG